MKWLLMPDIDVVSEEVVWSRINILLKAIELDLRQLIKDNICPNFPNNILYITNESIRIDCLYRYIDSYPDGSPHDEGIETTILDHLNPKDGVEIVKASSTKYIRTEDKKHVINNAKELTKFLGPARRIQYHYREEPELAHLDQNEIFDSLFNLSKKLTKESSIWKLVEEKLAIIFALTHEELKLNKDNILSEEDHRSVFHNVQYHNLPVPDYDNWKFVGRSEIIKIIREELLVNKRPSIFIHGEGGIGKTAITRRICEALLRKGNFDLIWWHSSKRRSYLDGKIKIHSESRISEIEKEIKKETGYSFDEIKEDGLRSLFILDNMESEEEADVVNITHSLSTVGQVILTGRNQIVGLAAYPRAIDGFNKSDASNFLKRVAKFYNQTQVREADESAVTEWCEKLGYSPLFIRSFVEAVKAGTQPSNYFKNIDEYDEIYDFIFYQTLDHFSEDSLALLHFFNAYSSPLSNILIGEITGWDDARLSKAMMAIRQSPLVENVKTESYRLTEKARKYVRKRKPLSKLRESFDLEKIEKAKKNRDEFKERTKKEEAHDCTYFETESEEEEFAGYHVNIIVSEFQNQDIDSKLNDLIDQKDKWPDFSPIDLHLAMIYIEKSDNIRAIEHFEEALRYETKKVNREKIIFQYIKFLLSINSQRNLEEIFAELDQDASIEIALLDTQIKLNAKDSKTYGNLYKLYDRKDLIPMPSHKSFLTSSIMEIVIDTSKRLLEQNSEDALHFLDDFLKRLKGEILNFIDDQKDVFIFDFLDVYIKVMENKMETHGYIEDDYTDNLKSFFEGRRFTFKVNHFEQFLKYKNETESSIFSRIYHAVNLNKDGNYELFLAARKKRSESEGKIIMLSRNNRNAGYGHIIDRHNRKFIFYENTVKDNKYDNLNEKDKVKWDQVDKQEGKKFDVAYGVSKIPN